MKNTATAWPIAWPPGVIGRYLTLAGEALADPNTTVDVSGSGTDYIYRCRGCRKHWDGSTEFYIRSQAEQHASTCRALPRPEGS